MMFVQCLHKHFDMIDPYPGQFLMPDTVSGDLTYAQTLLADDGRVLACAGVVPLWRAVGEAWSVLSSEVVEKHPLTLQRQCKKFLWGLQPTPFKRLQAIALADHPPASEWLEALGFTHEGTHPKQALGEYDVLTFGRVV